MVVRGGMTDFAEWEREPFTYAEVGATRGVPPDDAHVVRAERVVGRGEAEFTAARDALLHYGMHRGAGLRVNASTPSARVGTVMICSAWFLGPIRVPCRVVYVVEEPDRAGFAYGTLPGHPESGEELFAVEWRADDSVVATVCAFSRPGRWYTRLGGPIARTVQALMTRRYLNAVEHIAATRRRGA